MVDYISYWVLSGVAGWGVVVGLGLLMAPAGVREKYGKAAFLLALCIAVGPIMLTVLTILFLVDFVRLVVKGLR